MTTAEQIARALGGRRVGSGFMVRCIAHEDSKPSLHLSDGSDRRLLVHCHAGCTQESLLARLRERGLWPANRGLRLSNGTRSRGEGAFNVARLQREGFAKLKHADALERWTAKHPATAGSRHN